MKKERGNFFIMIILLIGMQLAASCHKDAGKDKETVAPPVRVRVMEVGESSPGVEREYSGTVASEETTTLSFSVAGTIRELSVKEGSQVRKGQALGRVDAGDYENARNIAMAQLAEAQDGYERLKKLHDANALPEVKWVEMEQKLKQAQNAVEMANRTVGDAVLHSPVSGTVSRKFADVGQTIVPAQPIYEIVSTNALEVEVSLSEKEIGGIKEGQQAHVSFDTPGVEPVEGVVRTKSVVADPLTRSYTVKISLPSGEKQLLPGMLASVLFEFASDSTPAREGGITLPLGSVLLNEDNRWFVWIVKNGRAERRFVEVDELVNDGILVKQGLSRGDSVITAGMQKVGTGSKVTTN